MCSTSTTRPISSLLRAPAVASRLAILGALPFVFAAAPAHAAADGAALYAANCAACHQADADGQSGQFPPLKNRVDKIAGSAEGKTYLVDVLTHGLSGSIDAAGDSYAGFMPSFGRLTDEQIAAILSHVSSLGDTKPAPVFTGAEVAVARTHNLTAAGVNAERTALDAQHKLP